MDALAEDNLRQPVKEAMAVLSEMLVKLKATGDNLLNMVVQVEERSTRVQNEIDSFEEVIKSYHNHADAFFEATESTEGMKDGLEELLSNLENHADESFDDVDNGVEQTAESYRDTITSQVTSASDAMIDKAESAIANVKQFRVQLSERIKAVTEAELPQAVKEISAPVIERVDEFEAIGQQRIQKITDVLEVIREKTRVFNDFLENAKPILDQVKNFS